MRFLSSIVSLLFFLCFSATGYGQVIKKASKQPTTHVPTSPKTTEANAEPVATDIGNVGIGTTGKTNVLKTTKVGTEAVKFPTAPIVNKKSTGITRTKQGATAVFNGINFNTLRTGLIDVGAKQRALTDLKNMGCTILPDNPNGVFCKTIAQFNKAFDYLKKGNIDDVQADVSGSSTFKITETLTTNGTFSVTGTPTLYISKKGGSPKVVGKASFTMSYPIPILGNAPGCDPNNKALTDDQYHRRLVDQQNYFVDYRNFGLFSYGASKDDGVMKMSFDVTDVDVIRAINYANAHNSWGQTFYMTMVAKAGPSFIFPDPVCTQNGGSYSVVDHSQILRPYRIVQIQLKVVSSQ